MNDDIVKVVADTNTIISGLLWHGAPHTLLEIARSREVKLFTCPALLQELFRVLQRDKFAPYLSRAQVTPQELVTGYSLMTQVVELEKVEPVISADPDDDIVLACAVTAGAKIIISGDNHLLSLKQYQQIQIVTAREFLLNPNFC